MHHKFNDYPVYSDRECRHCPGYQNCSYLYDDFCYFGLDPDVVEALFNYFDAVKKAMEK